MDNQKKAKGDGFFSEKKHVVLLILFIIALCTAVFFITYGVSQLGKIEEGYNVITVDRDEDLPFYGSGVTLNYYLKGTRVEINEQVSMIKSAYAAILRKTFKMLDAETLYDDTPNLASISASPGTPVEVSYTLFGILRDAWEKTQRREGYSIFQGVINRFVASTVNANDGAEVDPENDPSFAALIAELRELYASPDVMTLTFNEEKRTVRLDLSPAYEAFLKSSGVDTPPLDLGILKNACRLRLIAEELISKGYTEAILESEDGMTVILPDAQAGEYCFYSPQEDGIAMSATRPAHSPGVCCLFRVFALNEDLGFYTIEKDGKTVYRHKYMTDFTDDAAVLSVMVQSNALADLADCAYEALTVLTARNGDEALARAAASKAPEWIVDLNDAKKALYLRGTEGARFVYDYEILAIDR